MKNIIKAIADFQQECPVILKDTSGYGYKYADLTQIDSVIKPLLAKHQLMIVQPLNGNTITTTIYHIGSGEFITSVCNVPFESIKYEPVTTEITKGGVTEKKTKYIIAGFEGMNTAQAYGSLITYFRRYTISSLLGLITDKDTDGTGEKAPAPAPAPPVKSAPAPQLTAEQKAAVESWNTNKDEITVLLANVKTVEDLTIVKESFPELLKYKQFTDLLTAKYNSIK